MKIRTMTITVLTATLFAVFALAAACGGDSDGGGDALTLQQYLERVEELSDTYNERTDEMEAQYDEDIAEIESDADGIRITNDLLRVGGNAVEKFADAVDKLNPPAEAQEVHEASVATGRAMVAGIDDLLNELEGLDEDTTRQEYEAFFETSVVNDLGDAFEQACFDTQDLAEANSISVDLQCSE